MYTVVRTYTQSGDINWNSPYLVLIRTVLTLTLWSFLLLLLVTCSRFSAPSCMHSLLSSSLRHFNLRRRSPLLEAAPLHTSPPLLCSDDSTTPPQLPGTMALHKRPREHPPPLNSPSPERQPQKIPFSCKTHTDPQIHNLMFVGHRPHTVLLGERHSSAFERGRARRGGGHSIRAARIS